MTASTLVTPRLPTLTDVEAAAGRLEGVAVRTPLLESPLLNERLGGRLLVKAEMLQWTGSFKFRGAYNRISQLDEAARRRGVVAFSSGNHAQGVAYAAKLLGVPAVIVMPADAPAIKIANTRAYGAEVVLYDRQSQDRAAIGGKIASERGSTLVPPYDDPDIIAGQGTIGLEIAEQCASLGVVPDAVLAATSGGGMIAGIALALESRLPGVPVYCAEPAGFDDHSRSLAAGEHRRISGEAQSFCDALLAPTPGEITFAVNRRLLKGGLVVSDAEVGAAMKTAFLDLKVVVEPGGAVPLAAVLSGKIAIAGRTLVVVTSGGNVDPATFAAALASTKSAL